MAGLGLDRSVVRNDICCDCAEACQSAFNVNRVGLQSSAIERARAVGWNRHSRGDNVERGGLSGAGERAVVDHPRDRPVGVDAGIGRVAAVRDVGDAIEHLLVIRQRVVAGQGQHPGRCIIARRDAGSRHVGRQHVAREEAAADRYRRRLEELVVDVAHRRTRRQRHGRVILGIGGRRRNVAERRRGILRRDGERGGRGGAVERAVVDHPRDRAVGVDAEIGRVGAARGVLNRIERRLPLRQLPFKLVEAGD